MLTKIILAVVAVLILALLAANIRIVQQARAAVIEKKLARRLRIGTDYNSIGKIQYLLGQRGIPIEDSIYTQQVSVTCKVPFDEREKLLHEITEATAGRARVTVSDPLYYKSAGTTSWGSA